MNHTASLKGCTCSVTKSKKNCKLRSPRWHVQPTARPWDSKMSGLLSDRVRLVNRHYACWLSVVLFLFFLREKRVHDKGWSWVTAAGYTHSPGSAEACCCSTFIDELWVNSCVSALVAKKLLLRFYSATWRLNMRQYRSVVCAVVVIFLHLLGIQSNLADPSPKVYQICWSGHRLNSTKFS